MLFNSFQFLFIFFPITFVIYYWIAHKNQVYAAAWLTSASLAFYGWWSPADIGLLVASVLFNYLVSQLLVLTFHKNTLYSKIVLIFGVSSNLILLFHFKYSAFIIENINSLIGSSITRPSNLLPLGISFFTFTQIAYLVDTYRERTKPFRFTYYALFVTYFPHLVAGPILHHREMLPQFSSKTMY
ncbi:MAG: MBOAT family protein, partial [Bdellovibrionales bacterium]